MGGYTLAYVLVGLNPFGGLFLAIPLALFKLHYPTAVALFLSVALSFVQVLVVDFFWERLASWDAFVKFVDGKRSERLEGYLKSRWAGPWIALISPWVGPWLIMALARFAQMRLRQVGPALFAGLLYVGAITTGLCLFAPDYLPEEARQYLE